MCGAIVSKRVSAGDTSEECDSKRLHFVHMDVFTEKPFAGNPLSVFTDARGLTDTDMQLLARETNLHETAFVLPRSDAIEAREGVKVRIFTPDNELPFGGHPVLGTAILLKILELRQMPAAKGRTAVSPIVLDLKIGRVPVSFRANDRSLFGEMRQTPPEFGRKFDQRAVADALELDETCLESDLPIQMVSTGLPFVIVPLRRLDTLQSLRPGLRRAYEYLGSRLAEAPGLYFVTRDTADPTVQIRARAIFPKGEDPATGSAAGCASAWMVKYGVARPDQTVTILQGVEVNRPSRLFVTSGQTTAGIANTRVGGHALPIMEGWATV